MFVITSSIERTIFISLTLYVSTYLCTKSLFSEYQADADVPQSPEVLSQHQDPLITHNTIEEKENRGNAKRETKLKDHDESKNDDADDKNEKDHLNYGHLDRNMVELPPHFKHKMFKMEMKPAGSSIRLRCAAEGKLLETKTLHQFKVPHDNLTNFMNFTYLIVY